MVVKFIQEYSRHWKGRGIVILFVAYCECVDTQNPPLNEIVYVFLAVAVAGLGQVQG